MVTTSCLDCEAITDKDYILFIPQSPGLGSEFRTRLELNLCSVKEENHIKLTLTRTTEVVDSEHADAEADRGHGILPAAHSWSTQSA